MEWIKKRSVQAGVVFVISAMLYILTMGKGFCPVFSADVISGYMLLGPYVPLDHGLFGIVVRTLAALPGPLAVKLNGLSAVCSAGSVTLFFMLMRDWPLQLGSARFQASDAQRRGRLMAAVLAVVVLIPLLPFWILATRAHPASFDLFVLMGCLFFLRRLFTQISVFSFLMFTFCWGLGMSENASFVIMTPLIALPLIYVVWRGGLLKTAMIASALVTFLLGLSFHVLWAWIYSGFPSFAYLEFENFGEVIWEMLVAQKNTLSFSTVGWALVFLGTFLPWAVVAAISLTGESYRIHRLKHLLPLYVFALLAVPMLFNLYPSPWATIGAGKSLMLPYLFFAAWVGRVFVYFYVVVRYPEPFSRFRFSLPKVVAPVFPALVVVLSLVAAGLSVRTMLPGSGDRVYRFCQQVVQGLDGRSWLLSEGYLDNSLRLAAHDEQVDLVVIAPRQDSSEIYRQYIADHIDDPHLKSLAKIGLSSFMQAWFSGSEDLSLELAALNQPDLWKASGYDPYPMNGSYFGARPFPGVDAEYREKNTVFWEKMQQDGWLSEPGSDMLAAWHVNRIMTMLSKSANNAGVLFEDANDGLAAYAQYTMALEIFPDNLSAQMNRLAIAEREKRPEASTLRETFDALVADLNEKKVKLTYWSLATYYGDVRSPQAYASQGYAWATVGSAATALRDVEKSIDMSSEVSAAQQLLLGRLYIQTDDPEKARKLYGEMLAREPLNLSALAAMYQLELREENFSEAEALVKQMEPLATEENKLDVSRFYLLIAFQSGNTEKALGLLDQRLKTNPEDGSALASTLLLLNGSDNEERLAEVKKRLKPLALRQPQLALALANVAMSRGDLQEAGDYLDLCEKAGPLNLLVLDMQLRLAVAEIDAVKIEKYVNRILRINSNAPYANYIMGRLRFADGDYPVAEASFKSAVRSQPSSDTFNYLAWSVQAQGRLNEALELCETGLELNPSDAALLDTYGAVLYKAGRYSDSEAALLKALLILPDDTEISLNLVKALAAQGKNEAAEKLLMTLKPVPKDLADMLKEVEVILAN